MRALRGTAGAITAGLIGYLFLVEIVSGVLQGFYIPLIPDLVEHLGIRDADFNWFEAAQLLVAALSVPVLAKLGDMYGHKRILLVSTVLTAGASWWLAFTGDFTSFLVAWALQGFYTVWLPLEVALIFDRGRRSGAAASATRKAAGLLVVALQTGAIVGALAGGRVFTALDGDVTLTLMIPAVAVTLVFFAILFGVPESEPLPGRSLDIAGFAVLSLGLLLITSGLTFLRINGAGTWWVYLLMAAGVAVFLPWGRYELRRKDPAIDLRVLRQPTMWPVQLTAALIGISLLGAQAPLSTFAGTERESTGYGLGLDAAGISYLIGAYLVSLIVGAVLFPIAARLATPRITLIVAAFFVAGGYFLFLPFHDTTLQVFTNMVVAGVGSGALVAALLYPPLARALSPRIALIVAAFLVAGGYFLFLPFHDSVLQVVTNMVVAGVGCGALVGALPAAAAAAAPRGQTGIAAALTNTTKTIGGSFASSVFAVVLAAGALQAAGSTASSLAGYLTVFGVCGAGALLAAPSPTPAWRPIRRRSRRCDSGARLQLAADHLVRGGLGHRLDGDQVEVDVERQLDRVHDRLGDVVGDKRMGDVVVHRVGPGLVAPETHQRELLRLHHAGGDLDHADRLPRELQAQHAHQGARGELRGVVASPALVGDVTRDRRDGDDVRTIPIRCGQSEQGQQRAGDPLHGDDVDVEHAHPVLGVAVLDGGEAQGAAGVVHQGVHRAETRDEVAQGVDLRLHGEVGHEDVGPGLRGERLEPVGAAGDAHHVPAVFAEPAHGGRADP
jgi:MFS family permease